MADVRTATAQDRPEVVRALAAAFADDPVIRWLLPRRGRDQLLFSALVRHTHSAPGSGDVAMVDGVVVGASLWDPPGFHRTGNELTAGPSFLRALRTRVVAGAALESTFDRHRPSGEFWYLAEVGATVQGQGVGSALLEHRLATITGPAYLESSNVANVPLYERFGFRVTTEFTLPMGGPTCWPMWRDAVG